MFLNMILTYIFGKTQHTRKVSLLLLHESLLSKPNNNIIGMPLHSVVHVQKGYMVNNLVVI